MRWRQDSQFEASLSCSGLQRRDLGSDGVMMCFLNMPKALGAIPRTAQRLTALPEDPDLISSTILCLTMSVTPAPRDPTPSSGICRHEVCTLSRDVYAGKTHKKMIKTFLETQTIKAKISKWDYIRLKSLNARKKEHI